MHNPSRSCSTDLKAIALASAVFANATAHAEPVEDSSPVALAPGTSSSLNTSFHAKGRPESYFKADIAPWQFAASKADRPLITEDPQQTSSVASDLTKAGRFSWRLVAAVLANISGLVGYSYYIVKGTKPEQRESSVVARITSLWTSKEPFFPLPRRSFSILVVNNVALFGYGLLQTWQNSKHMLTDLVPHVLQIVTAMATGVAVLAAHRNPGPQDPQFSSLERRCFKFAGIALAGFIICAAAQISSVSPALVAGLTLAGACAACVVRGLALTPLAERFYQAGERAAHDRTMGFPSLIGQKWFATATFLNLLSVSPPYMRSLNIIPAAAFLINAVVLGVALNGYRKYLHAQKSLTC